MTDPNLDDGEPDVVVTNGHTRDNASNLPARLLRQLIARYQGTSVGEQELAGKILDEAKGALWSRALLDSTRIRPPHQKVPLFSRIVVGVDPMVTDIASEVETSLSQDAQNTLQDMPGGSETGIIVAGLGVNGHGYVLDDLSLSASPLTWANKALWGLEKWSADRIIGEENNGGALIEVTLRSIKGNVPYKGVHASRGKITRAEPVAALYEQNKVHHVGIFPQLESQLVKFTGNPTQKSPDRLDALVWAITELMLGDTYSSMVGPVSITMGNQFAMGEHAALDEVAAAYGKGSGHG